MSGNKKADELAGAGTSLLQEFFFSNNLDFSCIVSALFLFRREWRRGRVGDREAISLYIDGPKMDCGVGAGFYSPKLGVILSLRTGKEISIFQAKVLDILEACNILVRYTTIAIVHSGSQVTILAIASPASKFKLLKGGYTARVRTLFVANFTRFSLSVMYFTMLGKLCANLSPREIRLG